MARKPRVVIVEDDPDALLMMRMNLEIVGFETSLAADGGRHPSNPRREAGRRRARLMLPVLDGFGGPRRAGLGGTPA